MYLVLNPTQHVRLAAQDLRSQLFVHSYDAGAKLHSNSWGSRTPTYTSFSMDMDQFMYENDDFVRSLAAMKYVKRERSERGAESEEKAGERARGAMCLYT